MSVRTKHVKRTGNFTGRTQELQFKAHPFSGLTVLAMRLAK